MDGWARRYIVVTPDGTALPCHQARSIPALAFESVRDRSLGEIWRDSPGFRAFRGEAWMPEPCRTCDERDRDFGGCRCQAFALLGDAAAHRSRLRARAAPRPGAGRARPRPTPSASRRPPIPLRLRRYPHASTVLQRVTLSRRSAAATALGRGQTLREAAPATGTIGGFRARY